MDPHTTLTLLGSHREQIKSIQRSWTAPKSESEVQLRKPAIASFLALLMLGLPTMSLSSSGESQLIQQVGARGDDASRENYGVRAEIRTHLYRAAPAVFDYFWVGTLLQNGAFIQFGYAFEPGYFCLKGMLVAGISHCEGPSVLLSDTDARWQWQYWPSARRNDFMYEIGRLNSAGLNGTWHEYSITRGSDQSTSIMLDREQVAEINYTLLPAQEPPMLVAEKVTASNEFSDLGPVEFRNLEYLKEDGWHAVDSLISLKSCGNNASCESVNSYGVSSKGANEIIAGSGGKIAKNGQLLWTSSYVILSVVVHSNVPFHVTTVAGDQELTGSAQVIVPKALFVDVWLTTSSIQSGGLLGLLGGVDEFQGWVGYGPSENRSIRVLMDQNRSLQATWHTNPDGAIRNFAILAVFLVLALVVLRIRKRSAITHKLVPQER